MLVYIDERRSKLIKVAERRSFSTDKGVIRADDLIGREFGDSLRLSTGATAYLLKPTLLDYMVKGFKRVTQVIYPKDLGLILLISDIGPGSRVIEGGVGTGFMTAVIAKYVGDEGHVYAYEVDKNHIEIARRNLRLVGLDHRVTFRNKDVRSEVEDADIDSAVLDIPDPWNALNTLARFLKPSATLVSFLPTINQVEKLVTYALTSKLFVDIRTYEIMLREYEVKKDAVRPKTRMVGHTGYIVFMRFLKT
ncbi:MAG: tRNA (adenine-N1)-methyltransferase [Sulfolobales archaeon]